MREGEITPREFGELQGIVKAMKREQSNFIQEMRKTIKDGQRYTDKQVASAAKNCEVKRSLNNFQGDVSKNLDEINLVLFGSQDNKHKGLLDIVTEFSPFIRAYKKFTKFSIGFTLCFFGGIGVLTYNMVKPIYDNYIANK